MNSRIEAINALGDKFLIDLAQFDETRFIKLKGWTLVIYKLDNNIQPLGCTMRCCYELADCLVLGINSIDKTLDCSCHLCNEHLDELVILGELEDSNEIIH